MIGLYFSSRKVYDPTSCVAYCTISRFLTLTTFFLSALLTMTFCLVPFGIEKAMLYDILVNYSVQAVPHVI